MMGGVKKNVVQKRKNAENARKKRLERRKEERAMSHAAPLGPAVLPTPSKITTSHLQLRDRKREIARKKLKKGKKEETADQDYQAGGF